uniref:hypothetical protein n=1 Tax=Clostridium sp. NkU-1 TaxID=1095009 RepID=UPI0032615333
MDQLTTKLYINYNGDHLMKDRKDKGLLINKTYKSLKHCNPDISIGLTAEQVRNRINAGAVNVQRTGLTPTIPGIISKKYFYTFQLHQCFPGGNSGHCRASGKYTFSWDRRKQYVYGYFSRIEGKTRIR